MNKMSPTFLFAFSLYLSVPVLCQNAIPPLQGASSSVALKEAVAQADDTPQSATSSKTENADYDVIIRNGRIIDGSGNPWVSGDVAIRGDRIAAIGHLSGAHGKREIDAAGLVVSPGFIDMLGQ